MGRLFKKPAFWVALVAVVAVGAILATRDPGETILRPKLTEYETFIREGKVKTATLYESASEVRGNFEFQGTQREYRVVIPSNYDDEIIQELRNAGIPTAAARGGENWATQLAFQIIPILVVFGVFLFLMSSMNGGGKGVMQFGKAKPKVMTKDQPKITFADVAGADEAVQELQEIKEFLESPAKFHAIGAKIPKGVLLFGPPGTGKTLLARAVAGEAGVPFFSISGSDFVEMFVGVGASRVRDLFQQAKSSAPCIIFMDEIDAVGRHRGMGTGGGNDEREQTLNQLLVEMDGFDPRTGIILIAATNRSDVLDPALLRPGRFDRQITVDRPDIEGRKKILAVHAADKPLHDDVDLEVLARRTSGFTGADLANLLNEAALITARHNGKQISMVELEDAIDRVIGGPERKNRVMSDAEKRVIAFHEGGHALVGHLLPDANPVHKVSIVARGRALGWTLSLPEEDRNLATRKQMKAEMAMAMGGRVAEEVVFGEPSTGASNDIEKLTQMARSMVTQYGMSDELGPQLLGAKTSEQYAGGGMSANYSGEVAAKIDAEVAKLVNEAQQTALDILNTHRDVLDNLAATLIEKETVDTKDLDQIWGHLPAWEGTPAPVKKPRKASTATSSKGERRTTQRRTTTTRRSSATTAAAPTPAAERRTTERRTTSSRRSKASEAATPPSKEAESAAVKDEGEKEHKRDAGFGSTLEAILHVTESAEESAPPVVSASEKAAEAKRVPPVARKRAPKKQATPVEEAPDESAAALAQIFAAPHDHATTSGDVDGKSRDSLESDAGRSGNTEHPEQKLRPDAPVGSQSRPRASEAQEEREAAKGDSGSGEALQ